MMEKLKNKREKSGLASREMSSLDEPGSVEPEKPKKEKKKKKNKVRIWPVLRSCGPIFHTSRLYEILSNLI